MRIHDLNAVEARVTAFCVNQALDNAHEGGFSFKDMTYLEVAEDMVNYDSELEMHKPQDLLTHIIEWYKMSDQTYRPRGIE